MNRLIYICFIVSFSIGVSAQHQFEVYFDFGKHTPNTSSTNSLDKWISENPDVEVTKLSGYADSVDADSYNKQLSQKRINSVLARIQSANIRVNDNVKLQPYGEDFSKSADQSKNRKVTINYRKPAFGHLAVKDTDSIYDDVPKLFQNIKQGDVIRLRTIHFFRNKEEVIPESIPVLEQLYAVLAANPKLTIEIHGHICCNPNIYDTKLSYRRAKYIFTYLLEKGIPLNQLAYKGFGSAYPIYPIPERSHAQQVANRRVEILIVRL